LVRDGVRDVVAKQWAKAMEDAGLKGLTIGNWESRVGPMIGMFSAGLPVKPIPLLKALQRHVTSLVMESVEWLDSTAEMSTEQLEPVVSGMMLRTLESLAALEDNLVKAEGAVCAAKAVCEAVEAESSLRAPILTAYGVGRGGSLYVSSKDRIRLLRAAASIGGCEKAFPCSHPTTPHQEL